MFGLFKKKSKIEILRKEHKKKLSEAYELSKTSRAQGDKKYAEAEEILKAIDHLKMEE